MKLFLSDPALLDLSIFPQYFVHDCTQLAAR